MDAPSLTLHLRGPFAVTTQTGERLAIRSAKAKGLFLLLAFAPSRQRTRSWLVEQLWPARVPQQGRASLRQDLASLRRALGPDHARMLGTDRTNVTLLAPVKQHLMDDPYGEAGILEDIDIPEPEFEDWLRDLRLRLDDAPAAPKPRVLPLRATDGPVGDLAATDLAAPDRPAPDRPPTDAPLRVGLRLSCDPDDHGARLMADLLRDDLATALGRSDGIEPQICDGQPASPPDVLVDISSAAHDGEWFARAQVSHGQRRYFSWASRVRVPLSFERIWVGPHLSRFAADILGAVTDCLAKGPAAQSPHVLLSRAAAMLYSGNADQIDRADAMLADVAQRTGSGVALAWRAFALMTRWLELRSLPPDAHAQADHLLNQALARSGQNPVTLALASMINLKLLGDADYGHHLAQRATKLDERNPYALDALSQSLVYQGDRDRSYRIALWAREAASALPNAFNWDMGASLSALSVGKLDEAADFARSSHFGAAGYRPALRYLYALSALRQDDQKTALYRKRLTALEPDFHPALIADPDYPMHTFRWLGLADGVPLD